MEIFQNDIFGNKHQTNQPKEKKKSSENVSRGPFPNITILDGVDEIHASNEAMLIHRMLQKKLLFSGSLSKKQKLVFMRILKNEMNIKSGNIDASTATRDSLLAFFCTK